MFPGKTHRQDGFQNWLTGTDAFTGDIGPYIETALIPPSRLDTLLASDTEYHGIAILSDQVEKTGYHGYWGGTRDRILDSEHDPLVNTELRDLSEPVRPPAGFGETVSVTMPANVCLARGGPNWSAAVGAERRRSG